MRRSNYFRALRRRINPLMNDLRNVDELRWTVFIAYVRKISIKSWRRHKFHHGIYPYDECTNTLTVGAPRFPYRCTQPQRTERSDLFANTLSAYIVPARDSRSKNVKADRELLQCFVGNRRFYRVTRHVSLMSELKSVTDAQCGA